MIKLAMLVDDELVDQRMYKRVINRSGLIETLLTFTYADEALEHLINNPELEVDVIFLDINMPRMNGFEFLEAAQSELGRGFAKVVVAMLTTSLSQKDQDRAKEFDVVRAYINKPLTQEDLEEVDTLINPQTIVG